MGHMMHDECRQRSKSIDGSNRQGDEQRLSLTQALDEVLECVDDDDVLLQGILQALESRGFGPMIFIPALLVLPPVGAIPGVPTIMAALIFIVALQRACGWRHPWLPAQLRRTRLNRARYERLVARIRPIAEGIDRRVSRRLMVLTGDVGTRVVAVLCMGLALTIPPLELMPFAAALPALAIMTFGLGISVGDGLLVAIGTVLTAVTMGAVFIAVT